MVPRRLIVTADDFGITAAVSEGILEAYTAGAIHRASAMTNMPAFAPACDKAVREHDLPLGVHGNLTCGRPLTEPARVESLVRPNGTFYPLRFFLLRLLARRVRPADIETELEAQIGVLKAAGRTPTHIDSHQHVHYLPGLARIWIRLAQRHGIRSLRFGRPLAARGQGPRAWVRDLALRTLAARTPIPEDIEVAPELSLFEAGSPLHLERATGPVEVVCHPGRHDAELTILDPASPDREAELAALKSLGLAQDCPEGRA